MKKVFIVILTLFFIGCANNKKEEDLIRFNSSASDTLLEPKGSIEKGLKIEVGNTYEFNEFLKRFSKDSIFRYNRINFPLKGYNSDAENMVNNYKWEKEEWDYYSKLDFQYEGNKNITTKIISKDSLMVWRLYKENSGYDINYHFKLYKNKWYLNYYSYKNY